jgi:hypothetical protein
MTKLSDLPEDFYLEYYRRLPQIDEKDIRPLWHNDYYDGPISGILLYQERIHWFQIFLDLRTDEAQDLIDHGGIASNHHFGRYLVLQLSEEQIREETYWHELFQQKVGTHTDYNENRQRVLGALKPRDLWDEFYEPYKTRKPEDFSDNMIVGWFETRWGSIKQDEDNDDALT